MIELRLNESANRFWFETFELLNFGLCVGNCEPDALIQLARRIEGIGFLKDFEDTSSNFMIFRLSKAYGLKIQSLNSELDRKPLAAKKSV